MFDTMQLMMLLPRVLKTSELAMKIFREGGTPEDYNKVVDELWGLMQQIPALKGLLVIIGPLVNAAKIILPEVIGRPETAKQLGFISMHQVHELEAAVEIFEPLLERAIAEGQAAQAAITEEDVDAAIQEDSK
jgi:hypothetical protein